MGPFADSHARSLSDEDFAAFEELLDQPDHDLYGWILGSLPTPPQFEHALMARLRAFNPAGVRGG